MATSSSYSTRSSSVKRILQEARELRSALADGIQASPLEDNLHEWHFTVRGPEDSQYAGGLYHGRILLPAAYPFKAPDILLMTPSARFELNKKICLTITGFHEESWQPAWGIRTALVGLRSFFATEAKGAIGGLDAPESERRRLAALSRDWTCPTCQMKNVELLPDETSEKREGKKPETPEDLPSATAQTEEPSAPQDRPVPASITPGSSAETVKAPPAQLNPSLRKTSSVPELRQDNVPQPTPTQQVSPEMRTRIMDVITRQVGGEGSGSNGGHVTIMQNTSDGRDGSPPPVWLDGAIGLVLVALASLLCRRYM